MSKSFFPNKTARQSLWGAFVLLLLLFVAFSYAYRLSSYAWRRPSASYIANDVLQAYAAASVFTQGQDKALWREKIRSGLRIHVAKEPLARGKSMTKVTATNLMSWIRKRSQRFRLSLLLPNGSWMQVAWNKPPWHRNTVGSAVLLLSLLILLWLILYALVKRLAVPIGDYTKALQRFSQDVNASPMPISGPREMQDLSCTFNDMQAQIRRLLKDRTQMLAAISHDLRTPITRLQLRAERVKNTEVRESMVLDLNEMEQMITSILSFARDYQAQEVPQRFDLVALLQSICDDLVDAGQVASLASDHDHIKYWGRFLGFKRAFQNIIENAIKYGNSAEVSLHQSDGFWVIKVHDQGPGIADDLHEKVFDPFF